MKFIPPTFLRFKLKMNNGKSVTSKPVDIDVMKEWISSTMGDMRHQHECKLAEILNQRGGIKMSNIHDTLKEREKTHGDYEKFCEMYQKVMAVIEAEAVGPLTPTQVTSVQMIVYKLCRILNGKANHKDHWKDISGYADLISRMLKDGE